MPTSPYFQKITFYENKTYFFIEGYDPIFDTFSLIRINRNQTSPDINLIGGDKLYAREEYEAILSPLSKTDGFRKWIVAHALLGFISILGGLYAVVSLRQRQIGLLFGKHHLYTIEKVDFLPLFQSYQRKASYTRGTNRYLNLLDVLNISKEFFYSFTYDLSLSAQDNKYKDATVRLNINPLELSHYFILEGQETKFVWNDFLLEPLKKISAHHGWRMPIIHGFLAQVNCSCLGRLFELTLIARRSRFYAGTRYRKRGINQDGDVANDVETEQILYDLGHSKAIMSFVMLRASVPIFWSQETNAMKPKPPIHYNRIDYNYTATRKHFKNLFSRYGSPILVVNLMKLLEDSDEYHLGKYFEEAVQTLNKELPDELKLIYKALDIRSLYKEANKKASDMIWMELSNLGNYQLESLGYFHCVGDYAQPLSVQIGAIRTNCVDCLDRTNVAQFAIGCEVLSHQLATLGIIPEPHLSLDSQITDILSEIYDLMGDHLSLQYGGSVAHKKYSRDRPKMMIQSKELLTSIQRHYTNFFADLERQHAINVFLGIFQPTHQTDDPNNILKSDDDWLHHHTLIDQLSPKEWWVAPLQYFFNQLRVIHTLPYPHMVLFFPLTPTTKYPPWLSMYGDISKPLRSIDEGPEMLYDHGSQANIKSQYSLPRHTRAKLSPFEWKIEHLYTYKPWIERAFEDYNHYLCVNKPMEVLNGNMSLQDSLSSRERSMSKSWGNNLISKPMKSTEPSDNAMGCNDCLNMMNNNPLKHPSIDSFNTHDSSPNNEEMGLIRYDESCIENNGLYRINQSSSLGVSTYRRLYSLREDKEITGPIARKHKTMSTPPIFDSLIKPIIQSTYTIQSSIIKKTESKYRPFTIPLILYNQIIPKLHAILSDSIGLVRPSAYELLSINLSDTIFVKTRSTHQQLSNETSPFSIPIEKLRIMHQLTHTSILPITTTQICMASQWFRFINTRKTEKNDSDELNKSPTQGISAHLAHRVGKYQYHTQIPTGSELDFDSKVGRHRGGMSRSLSPRIRLLDYKTYPAPSRRLKQTIEARYASSKENHVHSRKNPLTSQHEIVGSSHQKERNSHDKTYPPIKIRSPRPRDNRNIYHERNNKNKNTHNSLHINTKNHTLDDHKEIPQSPQPLTVVLSGGYHQYTINYENKRPTILVLRPDDPEANKLKDKNSHTNHSKERSNTTTINTEGKPCSLELDVNLPNHANNKNEIRFISHQTSGTPTRVHTKSQLINQNKRKANTICDSLSHHPNVYFDKLGKPWIAPHHSWLSIELDIDTNWLFVLPTYVSASQLCMQSEQYFRTILLHGIGYGNETEKSHRLLSSEDEIGVAEIDRIEIKETTNVHARGENGLTTEYERYFKDGCNYMKYITGNKRAEKPRDVTNIEIFGFPEKDFMEAPSHPPSIQSYSPISKISPHTPSISPKNLDTHLPVAESYQLTPEEILDHSLTEYNYPNINQTLNMPNLNEQDTGIEADFMIHGYPQAANGYKTYTQSNWFDLYYIPLGSYLPNYEPKEFPNFFTLQNYT